MNPFQSLVDGWLRALLRDSWIGFLGPGEGDGGTAEEKGEQRGRGREIENIISGHMKYKFNE